MAQQTEFTRFVALVDVAEPDAQNIQELAALWGDIQQEFDHIDASIEESYAVLGEFDFLVIFEGPTTETAFQADVVLERHGLTVQTMEIIDTRNFSELVTDH